MSNLLSLSLLPPSALILRAPQALLSTLLILVTHLVKHLNSVGLLILSLSWTEFCHLSSAPMRRHTDFVGAAPQRLIAHQGGPLQRRVRQGKQQGRNAEIDFILWRFPNCNCRNKSQGMSSQRTIPYRFISKLIVTTRSQAPLKCLIYSPQLVSIPNLFIKWKQNIWPKGFLDITDACSMERT